MWKVYLSKDVQNFLKKLDKHLETRIRKSLKKLKTENPFYYLEHFEGQDYFKYRTGEHRALIDVDFKNKILKIQVLDHRKIIYKRKKK